MSKISSKTSTYKAHNYDFRYIYHVVTSKLWIILTCSILWMVAGTAYILLAPKIYQGLATIQVDQEGEKVVNMSQVGDEDFKSDEMLRSVEGNLMRSGLLIRTLKRPEFAKNPYLKNLVARVDDPNSERDLIDLSKSISAQLRRETRLIDVTVDYKDGKTAQDLANGLVDEFISEMVQTQSGMSENASQFLMEEATRLQKKLSTAELEIQQDKGLADLHQRILDQTKVIDDLNQRYLEKHPTLIQAKALLKDLENQFLNELREKNPAAVTITPKNEDDFRKIISSEESRYNVLQQDLATDQEIYESVVQRLKETNVTKGVQAVSVREVEKSRLPTVPIWPKKIIVLAVSLVMGFVTGLGFAFFISGLDSSFHQVDDAEEYLEQACLAAVSQLDSNQKPIKSRESLLEEELSPQHNGTGRRSSKASTRGDVPLVLLDYPSSLVAEAFRNLRAALKLLGRQSDRRTFLFTSAVPAEGKSFTCSNYAISLAQGGNRVLLIDGDLRQPTLHHIFKAESSGPGVSEYLTDDHLLASLVRKTRIDNLDVLFAGGLASNPAELLSGGGFKQLLEEACLTYDRIVIDSSPILSVSDTLLIAADIQTVCLVIRSGRTPRHAVRKAMLLLEKSGGKISGFVFNCLPKRKQSGYSGYYYSYQSIDKYGNAYGAEVRNESGR